MMHTFDIDALLTMMAINKLTDRTGADPKKIRKWTPIFFFSPNVKTTNAAVKTQTRWCL